MMDSKIIETQASTSNVKLLDDKAVALQLGISVKSLWRSVDAGRFPKPFRVGLRNWRWIQKRVDVHLEKLAEDAENE